MSSVVIRWAVYVLLFCVPGLAGASALTPFSARYTVKSAGLKMADTRFTLSQQASGEYVYRSSAEPIGILAWFKDAKATERSRLLWKDGDIIPLEYEYRLENGDEKRNYRSLFDWSTNTATVTKSDSVSEITVPGGTLDRFVLQLAVMLDLRRGRSRLDYTVLDSRRLRKYRFKKVGTTTVHTPAGKFETVVVRSDSDKDSKRVTTFWCAPALNFLPVMVTYNAKGAPQYKMVLRDATGLR